MINPLTIKKFLFSSEIKKLILGYQDGIVRIYGLPSHENDIDPLQPTSHEFQVMNTLETKGGPIQSQLIHDTTRLNGVDIVVADSRGLVTLFSNGQILKRKQVSVHAIHHMVIEDGSNGTLAIVTADAVGNISAFAPYVELWSLRLADLPQLKAGGLCPKVLSLLSTQLTSIYGLTVNYIMATDNCGQLYLIQNGKVVLVTRTPQNITAMCSGHFVDPEEIETNDADGDVQSALGTQIALGSDSGAIYIMSNFQVYTTEFANINYPIRQMKTLKAGDSQGTDSILCGGHFNALSVLRNGAEIAQKTMPDWVTSIVTEDIDDDGTEEVIVSCLNDEVFGLKLGFT